MSNLLTSETRHTTNYWDGNPANTCDKCTHCTINTKHPVQLVCKVHERVVSPDNKCLQFRSKKG